MSFRTIFSAALLVFGFANSASSAEPQPLTAKDLVTMDRVLDPQPSPDGKWIAFVLRQTDLAANRGRTDVWLLPASGGEARRLTQSPAGDSDPRWSADGSSLYFLSSRSGSNQLWRLSLGGGEAEPVTSLPVDLGSYKISRDGKQLVFSASVFPDCESLQCTADRLAASKTGTGQVYDRLFVRHWDSWSDGRRNHLFVMPLPVSGPASGTPVDLSKSLDADVPSMPFGGAEEYSFTPDGTEVVFAARISGNNEPWSTNFDLYAMKVDGSGTPRNLTANNPAGDTQPQFSPDGKTLVYLAMSRPGYESDRLRIMVQAWPSGATARELAPGWDRSPDAISFSADGKELYATANDLGHGSLFALDLATGKSRRLHQDGTVQNASPLGGDRIVFVRHTMSLPAEIHSLKPDGSALTQLSQVNRERLAGLRFGAFEQLKFKGAAGEDVYGWVVQPANFDPAKKYPVAFLIHGGPQGSWHNDFHYRWNPQIYAGAGYGVVVIDFHGSTGYGQAFTDAIRNDWGGKPLEDLQKGLAAALAKHSWLDGSRACALGASYGGFMINWIAGNWFDAAGNAPFRCLVNHDGLFDQRSMYYSTEELWFPEWEFGSGAAYHQNPAAFEKWSPVHQVAKWKTPMLVIHGEQDFRVPYTQGLATFTALQRRGIPSKFLYFPDENHWVLKPNNSLQWHETVLGWLGEWTKP